MSNDVIKKWCVFSSSDKQRLSANFNSRLEAQAWMAGSKKCVVAEVMYDFRNWEPVDAEHPLTQADNGCAVRVDGLEAGVIDDGDIGTGLVFVRLGSVGFNTQSITHVARPPKPPRKTIEWFVFATYSVGRVNEKFVATIVVERIPGCVFATVTHDGKMDYRMFESSNCDTAAAMNWCERVVNGDEA